MYLPQGARGAVILGEKERLTATYCVIISFFVFAAWYLRSHQSPRLESLSEGVAVGRYLPRIPWGGGVARGRQAAVTLLL